MYIPLYTNICKGCYGSASSLGNWPNLRLSLHCQGFFVAALRAALWAAPASFHLEPLATHKPLPHTNHMSKNLDTYDTCPKCRELETQLKQEAVLKHAQTI